MEEVHGSKRGPSKCPVPANVNCRLHQLGRVRIDQYAEDDPGRLLVTRPLPRWLGFRNGLPTDPHELIALCSVDHHRARQEISRLRGDHHAEHDGQIQDRSMEDAAGQNC